MTENAAVYTAACTTLIKSTEMALARRIFGSRAPDEKHMIIVISSSISGTGQIGVISSTVY